MPHYTLTAGAKKDLIGIWNYTYDTWGEAQADSYLHKLEQGFASITKNTSAHRCPLPSYPGVRSIHCEHHYIFFFNTDTPIILAILHEKMDLMLRLNKILLGN